MHLARARNNYRFWHFTIAHLAIINMDRLDAMAAFVASAWAQCSDYSGSARGVNQTSRASRERA
jgi:hypothetical protein